MRSTVSRPEYTKGPGSFADMVNFWEGRHAGLMVPLFSLRSSESWGIGEIADIQHMAAWLRAAGLDMLQILPVNEMAPGQISPYSAMSAQAIDPIFIAVHALVDFGALGAEGAFDRAARERLDVVRSGGRLDHAAVRALKAEALRLAFDRFVEEEWRRESPRACAFKRFLSAERWWLDDYALFRVLHVQQGHRPWWEWDAALRDRTPRALEDNRLECTRELLFVRYLQWVAHEQWLAARSAAQPVGIVGDLPFMVSADSADVWANQRAFTLEATVGTPPDAFSVTGQDWGLPAYRWDVMAEENFAWLRERARRAAELYDAYRVDHLVGFYRTYVRPVDGSTPYFSPATDAEQRALGETILDVLQSAGARMIAEDLGTVPDFVRQSMAERDVPGHKVFRWERLWSEPGEPFREPAAYPPISMATTGTHDTETLAEWWDRAPLDERVSALQLPSLAAHGFDPARPFDHELRDTLLGILMAAGSDFVVFPVQDIFGWRDRINVPATIGNDNWCWRVPWPVDAWLQQPEARERADRLRSWTRVTSRR
ncbi:MAG: 4-alpha-glucanotransferase [Luteitalea sp.]|nr:4-alpha-glucanotransferase [Luteitalea sp.]